MATMTSGQSRAWQRTNWQSARAYEITITKRNGREIVLTRVPTKPLADTIARREKGKVHPVKYA